MEQSHKNLDIYLFKNDSGYAYMKTRCEDDTKILWKKTFDRKEIRLEIEKEEEVM